MSDSQTGALEGNKPFSSYNLESDMWARKCGVRGLLRSPGFTLCEVIDRSGRILPAKGTSVSATHTAYHVSRRRRLPQAHERTKVVKTLAGRQRQSLRETTTTSAPCLHAIAADDGHAVGQPGGIEGGWSIF